MRLNLLEWATTLTKPPFKAHEYWRRMQLVETLHPDASRIEQLGRKIIFGLGMLVCGFLSPWTVVGLALKRTICRFQTNPLLELKGLIDPIETPQQIKHLSWNIACLPGGWSISNAGVMPWPFRMKELVAAIKVENADVVTLYEVFTVEAALALYHGLKDVYSNFYYHHGSRSIGFPSGIFVATRLKVTQATFTPFPLDLLVGRTKGTEKGVVQLDLVGLSIFATHLQHSEHTDQPTQEEVTARQKQMALIKNKVDAVSGPLIITGDLNMGDEEWTSLQWGSDFQRDVKYGDKKTWGGDKWCAISSEIRFRPQKT